MREKLLKLSRMHLWEHRFMLWWRNIAVCVVFVYTLFWLFSPALLAIYMVDSCFSFLLIPCVAAFFTNGSLLFNEDRPLGQTMENLVDGRKELKRLVAVTKSDVSLFKGLRTNKADALSPYELEEALMRLGFHEEWVPEIIKKLECTE